MKRASGSQSPQVMHCLRAEISLKRFSRGRKFIAHNGWPPDIHRRAAAGRRCNFGPGAKFSIDFLSVSFFVFFYIFIIFRPGPIFWSFFARRARSFKSFTSMEANALPLFLSSSDHTEDALPSRTAASRIEAIMPIRGMMSFAMSLLFPRWLRNMEIVKKTKKSTRKKPWKIEKKWL